MSSSEEASDDLVTSYEGSDVGVAVGKLLMAAAKGNVDKVETLLEDGVDPAQGDYDGRTALHLACSEGREEVVEYLLEHLKVKALNQVDRFGNTPLDDADRAKHEHIVAIMEEHGAKRSASGEVGKFIEYCSAGDLQRVKSELEQHAWLVNEGDYDKRTPLHLAAAHLHLDVVEYLLAQGADAGALDRFGGTPLDDAVRHKSRGANAVADALRDAMEESGEVHDHALNPKLAIVFTILEIVMIVCFVTLAEYDDDASPTIHVDGVTSAQIRYPAFQDVNVMIYIGFGFLMTFLRKYGFSSVGLNFLVSAFVVQFHILVGGLWHKIFADAYHPESKPWEHKIGVGLESLVLGNFAAGAVLISFGALLGKVSPFQLLVMAIWEVFWFSCNENIGLELGVTDIGGSMVVHTFGAYFGLACSWMLSTEEAKANENNSSSYRSDLFAMIGTIFLWIFWPSFNGAFADGTAFPRVVVNTTLSLAGSCVMGFLASNILRGESRFDMVDIQNATLAGGVAIGTSANLAIGPGAALLVGCVAGAWSVIGYTIIQPLLEKKLGLHDTAGVHNLHGMPGVIGGISGACVVAAHSASSYSPEFWKATFKHVQNGSQTVGEQAGYQVVFLVITIAFALISGAIAGAFLRLPLFDPPKQTYTDDAFWEVPGEETPYYFDARGLATRVSEITHMVGAKKLA